MIGGREQGMFTIVAQLSPEIADWPLIPAGPVSLTISHLGNLVKGGVGNLHDISPCGRPHKKSTNPRTTSCSPLSFFV